MSGRAALRLHEGGSLLEVLIALTIVAVAMVGGVASLLRVDAVERSAARREQAMVIAASVAAAMRDRLAASFVLSRWQAYAAAVLPGAQVSIVDRMPGVALAVVRWAESRADGPVASSTRDGCLGDADPGVLACAVVPFIR